MPFITLIIALLSKKLNSDSGKIVTLIFFILSVFSFSLIINKDTTKNILEMNLPNDTVLMFVERDIRNMIDQLGFTDVGKTALHGLFNDIIDTSQKLYGISNVPVVHIYNQFINTCIVSYLIIFTLF